MKVQTTDDALDAVFEGKNVFVHGAGGCGKSYFIESVMNILGDDTVVVCPTGISAINVGGVTCHSLFKLPLHVTSLNEIKRGNRKTSTLLGKNSPVERIIIDEIGMVRNDAFQQMDRTLRNLRRVNKPFGGLQVICVGDFLQFAPILNYNDRILFEELYGNPYCFMSQLWEDMNFTPIFLSKVYRQSDAEMIKNLLRVRKGDASQTVLDFFNKRVLPCPQDSITLCITNARAEFINKTALQRITGTTKIYTAIVNNFKERPVPDKLALKVGARVLVCSNGECVTDKRNVRYVNGDGATVVSFGSDYVNVMLDRVKEIITLEKITYEKYESYVGTKDGEPCIKKKVVGTYTQIPLRLMYASTIHKVQGMTLDNVHLDLEKSAMALGQVYVALSRCKSLEGLTLERAIRPSDVKYSQLVVRWLEMISKRGAYGRT